MSFSQIKTLFTKEEALWFLAWVAKQRQLPASALFPSYFRLQEKLRRHEGFHFPLDPEFSDWRQAFEAVSLKLWTNFYSQVRAGLARGRILLYPGHLFYPFSFLSLADAPFILHMEGSPIWLGAAGLSVVGSREPSQQSLQWLEENLGSFLEKNSVFTVSGGARGVDQRVHRISLRKQMPTVAFLPAGLSRLYPESLLEIRDSLLKCGGAFLSEFDPDQRMAKHHFIQRNRLIAALGEVTLVVEARRRSGTLLTARAAVEQGKALLILPTHPLDRQGQGGLDLLCEGATPVRDETDLTLFFRSEQRTSELILQRSFPPIGGGLKYAH
jgi:DNA processing protein